MLGASGYAVIIIVEIVGTDEGLVVVRETRRARAWAGERAAGGTRWNGALMNEASVRRCTALWSGRREAQRTGARRGEECGGKDGKKEGRQLGGPLRQRPDNPFPLVNRWVGIPLQDDNCFLDEWAKCFLPLDLAYSPVPLYSTLSSLLFSLPPNESAFPCAGSYLPNRKF